MSLSDSRTPGQSTLSITSPSSNGARWIWAELETNLPGAVGGLGVDHASEHVHAAAVSRGGDAQAMET